MDIMDYYHTNTLMFSPITDSVSLHDMIEKDIKDEPYENNFLDDSIDWHSNVSMQNDVVTVPNTHTRSNTDPNLLVNPQTGLPVGMGGEFTNNSCRGGLASHANKPSQMHCDSLRTSSSSFYDSSANASAVSSFYDTTAASKPHSTASAIGINGAASRAKIELVSETMSSPQSSDDVLSLSPESDSPIVEASEKIFPKPAYSYSCLIAMALKNSETGALPVSEIYSFMTENFPYFKTARDGWKNSVRHNLSLNKCFEKIDNPKASGCSRKGCLWGLNPKKIEKMEEEICKWRKKDSDSIRRSMANPDILDILEKGHLLSMSPRHPNNILNSNCSNFKNKLSRSTFSPISVVHRSPKHYNFTEAQYLMEETSDDVDESILADLALQSGLWDDLTSMNDFSLNSGSNASKPAVYQTSNSSLTASIKNATLTRLLCSSGSPISLNQTSATQHRSPLST